MISFKISLKYEKISFCIHLKKINDRLKNPAFRKVLGSI